MELLKKDWRFVLSQSDSYFPGQSWRLLCTIAFKSKVGPLKYIVIRGFSSTYLNYHKMSVLADIHPWKVQMRHATTEALLLLFVVSNKQRLIVILCISQETLRECREVQMSVNTEVFGNLWQRWSFCSPYSLCPVGLSTVLLTTFPEVFIKLFHRMMECHKG